MKATEAPEKLYITLDAFTEDGRTFVLDHRIDYPICTEYTNTDAFIEKACSWLKENGGSYWMDDYDLPTDELVKDFKNYMEGE